MNVLTIQHISKEKFSEESIFIITFFVTGKFYLNKDTGFFMLKETLDYDYGLRSYTLTVNVTDGVFGDEATIYVTVENVNDVPPLVTNPADSPFSIDIAEVSYKLIIHL